MALCGMNSRRSQAGFEDCVAAEIAHSRGFDSSLAIPAQTKRAAVRRRSALIALVLLTVVAGWLRFTATSFGLPDHYRPDEEYMVSRALGFEHSWDPHFALYPAAQMYVQHAALRVYAVTVGHWRDFRAAYADPGAGLAYLVCRRVSAAMGTATVPVIFAAGALAYGTAAGMGAAAIIAVATLAERNSKYATTDAAAVLWISLALIAILTIARRGRTRDYLAAGLLTGVASATKYPAGALVFAIFVAHLEMRRRNGRSLPGALADFKLYIAAAASIAAFACATPYFFLDRAQTVHAYEYQRGFELHGVGNTMAGHGPGWLFLRAMPASFGWPLAVLMLFAMAWIVARPRPGTWALLSFVAICFAAIAASHYVFYRYLLIPMPAMALIAGLCLSDLARLGARAIGARPAAGCAIVALGLILTPCAVRDVELNHLLLQTDTRTIARQWIQAHLPPGTKIAAIDATTPYGKPQLLSPYQLVPFKSVRSMRARGIRWLLADSFPPLAFYSPGPDPAQMEEIRSQAKLTFEVNSLRPDAPAPVFDPADAFYAPLANINSMVRPGPCLRIWKLK